MTNMPKSDSVGNGPNGDNKPGFGYALSWDELTRRPGARKLIGELDELTNSSGLLRYLWEEIELLPEGEPDWWKVRNAVVSIEKETGKLGLGDIDDQFKLLEHCDEIAILARTRNDFSSRPARTPGNLGRYYSPGALLPFLTWKHESPAWEWLTNWFALIETGCAENLSTETIPGWYRKTVSDLDKKRGLYETEESLRRTASMRKALHPRNTIDCLNHLTGLREHEMVRVAYGVLNVLLWIKNQFPKTKRRRKAFEADAREYLEHARKQWAFLEWAIPGWKQLPARIRSWGTGRKAS